VLESIINATKSNNKTIKYQTYQQLILKPVFEIVAFISFLYENQLINKPKNAVNSQKNVIF